MAWWAALISAGIGLLSQSKANKGAASAGAANRKAAGNIEDIYGNFGGATIGIADSLIGTAERVSDIPQRETPRAPAFASEAAGLLADGNRLATDLAQENRRVAVGEGNLESFGQLKADALDMANFDFSSIPRDILQQLDSSALARGNTGLAGLSERLSFDQKLNLSNIGENRFFRALGYDTAFVPPTLSADNLFERSQQLAVFQQNENQRLFANELNRASVEGGLLASAGDLTFRTEATRAGGLTQAEMLRAGNDPGAISAAGRSALLGSLGQGVSSVADAYQADQTSRQSQANFEQLIATVSANNSATV